MNKNLLILSEKNFLWKSEIKENNCMASNDYEQKKWYVGV